jgi:hypothetical protein
MAGTTSARPAARYSGGESFGSVSRATAYSSRVGLGGERWTINRVCAVVAGDFAHD